MRKLQVSFSCLVGFLFVSICSGQLIRVFVSWHVTDDRGLPFQFQIALTNTHQRDAQTETNSSGFYRFVAVDSGEYSIEFKLPGFEKPARSAT